MGPEGAALRSVDVYGPDWQWVLASAPEFESEGHTVRELLEWVARETGWTVPYEDARSRGEPGRSSSTALPGLRPDRPRPVCPGPVSKASWTRAP